MKAKSEELIKLIELTKNGKNLENFANFLKKIEKNDLSAIIDEPDENIKTVLHMSVHYQNFEIVKLLLEHGANTDIRDAEKRAPLDTAAGYQQFEIVKLLLEHGANIDILDYKGRTPLYTAIYWEHIEIVKLLLEYGASINIRDSCKETPLYMAIFYQLFKKAASHQNFEIVKLLLEHGANIDIPDDRGRTPLNIAAGNQNFKIVKLLLEHGANTDIRDCARQTPLYIAVGRQNFEIVKLLLEHGANPDIPDHNGKTPLYRAVDFENFGIAKLLLEHGANPDIPDHNGKTPLYAAVENRNLNIFNLLLTQNSDINIRKKNIITILNLAVLGKSGYMTKFLLDNGDIDITDIQDGLHLAARYTDLTVGIKNILLSNGARLDIKDQHGHTPLFSAILGGKIEVAQHFITDVRKISEENQTDIKTYIRMRDKGQQTLLHLALKREASRDAILSEELAKQISNDYTFLSNHITLGLDLVLKMHNKIGNFANEYDRIPELELSENLQEEIKQKIPELYSKVQEKYISSSLDLVKFLVEEGLYPDMQDNEGQTALHLAVYYGRQDIADLLINAQETINRQRYENLAKILPQDFEISKKIALYDIENKNGETSLHIAVKTRNIKMVEFLLEKGANPDIHNKHGFTPLYLAIIIGNTEIVDLLIDKGANINAKDKRGITPLDLFAKYGNLDKIKILTEKLKLNLKNVEFKNILQLAAAEGHLNVVEFFVEKGVDPNIQDDLGRTALHYAATRTHVNIVKLLLKNGARPYKKDKDGKIPLDYVTENVDNYKIIREVFNTAPIQTIKLADLSPPSTSPIICNKKDMKIGF